MHCKHQSAVLLMLHSRSEEYLSASSGRADKKNWYTPFIFVHLCWHIELIPYTSIEEDRYIEEALTKSNATNSRKKRLFRHEESKFTDFNQTVVIW